MIRIIAASALALFLASAAWASDPSASAPTHGAKDKSDVATPLAAMVAKPFVYTPMESDVVSGKDAAPVVLVEYASLSCPHCSHFYINELPGITAKYIDTGKVKLVYRNYPLNDPALKAAELVECAPEGSRHAFIKVLFSTQLKWAYDASYRDALSNIAVLGGIDRLKFESCMNDKSIEKKILGIAKEAADDYRINSTPSFFINQNAYKGDHDTVSLGKALDAALDQVDKK